MYTSSESHSKLFNVKHHLVELHVIRGEIEIGTA